MEPISKKVIDGVKKAKNQKIKNSSEIKEATYAQDLVCEVCGRKNPSKRIIELCEQNHENSSSTHPWWMQKDNIECTVDFYQRAIEFLKKSEYQVEIYESDESGRHAHVIAPISQWDFWLDSFKTKREALKFCKELGWKVISD